MTTPLAGMIHAAVRCTKCGARFGGCDCWIKLRCPCCGKTKSAERDNTDPPGTAVVETTCDECDNGDFAEVVYYEAHGAQLGAL